MSTYTCPSCKEEVYVGFSSVTPECSCKKGGSTMRLQEIRNKIDTHTWFEAYGLSEDDLEYLLNRIEKYEAALKEIVNSIQYWDGPTCAHFAEEALKENTTPKAE